MTRRPFPRRRPRSFTLVELLLAATLTFLLLGMLWNIWFGAGRQGIQVEERADHVSAALVVQEALAWDLQRSLPLDVLAPEERPRGERRNQVTLPLHAGFDAGAKTARRFRTVTYRFDAAERALFRGVERLPVEGLAAVEFGWSRTPPTLLEVRLTGENSLGGPPPRLTLHLPAPRGTDGGKRWRLAEHHRGAAREL